MAPINPAFRWLNCGFLRVFTAEQGIRLIDTFVTESCGFTELDPFICATPLAAKIECRQ